MSNEIEFSKSAYFGYATTFFLQILALGIVVGVINGVVFAGGGSLLAVILFNFLASIITIYLLFAKINELIVDLIKAADGTDVDAIELEADTVDKESRPLIERVVVYSVLMIMMGYIIFTLIL